MHYHCATDAPRTRTEDFTQRSQFLHVGRPRFLVRKMKTENPNWTPKLSKPKCAWSEYKSLHLGFLVDRRRTENPNWANQLCLVGTMTIWNDSLVSRFQEFRTIVLINPLSPVHLHPLWSPQSFTITVSALVSDNNPTQTDHPSPTLLMHKPLIWTVWNRRRWS